MKILVLSDLHVEFAPFRPPLESAASADVVVLAGDIHQENLAPSWARRTFPDKPIVLVAGNHEFYSGHWERTLDSIRQAAYAHEVHFLEDTAVTISGVRFLGTTLWTDFEYFGAELRHKAALAAQRYMADYRLVEGCTPQATIERHKVSRAWLERELAAPAAGERQVVVTHHYPRKDSTPKHYRDELSVAQGLRDHPLTRSNSVSKVIAVCHVKTANRRGAVEVGYHLSSHIDYGNIIEKCLE